MRRSSASWRSVTHERFCVSHILRQVWDDHVITKLGEDADLLQIDRLVLHELSGSQAVRALAEAGREPMSRSQVFTVIVPVELPMENVRSIAEEVAASNGAGQVTVDLETQTVTSPQGMRFAFGAPETLRQMLLQGVDEIALTLAGSEEIDGFRTRDLERRPCAYVPSRSTPT